jgi:hypothetical protein
VDEVEHIHVAYNIRDGRVPYADFWEGHNPLLHVLLVPVVDVDDAVASFQRARMVTLLLLLATVAMGAVCARRLGGNVAAAITAALLLLHSTFIERGMEVRPDIGLALCAMIALALQLSQRPVLHRYCWQALALSAAFLFTTKAVFICFAFGVVWLWSAVRDRRPALVAVPMAVWLAPVIAMIAVFAIAGNLDEYWDYNVRDALFHAGRSADFSFSPWKYMGREVGRNRVFVAAAVVGIGYGFAVGWGRSRRARSWGAGRLVPGDVLRRRDRCRNGGDLPRPARRQPCGAQDGGRRRGRRVGYPVAQPVSVPLSARERRAVAGGSGRARDRAGPRRPRARIAAAGTAGVRGGVHRCDRMDQRGPIDR